MIYAWKNPRLTKPNRKKLEFAAQAAAKFAGLPEFDWDLEVLFTDDRHMAKFNEEIVGHLGTTDVITLSYLDGDMPVFPGDTGIELIINPDAALREGEKRKNSDYPTELLRYLIHGLLHSAGFDDLDPASRSKMRRRERYVLKKLSASGVVAAELFPL